MATPERPRPQRNRVLRMFAPWDLALIAAPLIGALAFIPLAESRRPQTVTIYRGDELLARYPLSDDRTFTIVGMNGPMEIAIDDGSVRVSRSSCPNQMCVRTGSIGAPGRQIICAPNHVIVQIPSPETSDEVDGVAR